MSKTRHPNLIHLEAATITPPFYAAVMPFVAHGSLHDLLHKKCEPLTFSERLNIAHGIASGMWHLSDRLEIIHRDLKPSNILMDKNNVPRIGDFGESFFSSRSLTVQEERPRGTPLYCAPEIWKCERFGHPSDVFSFAIVCHELFSGEEPYKDAVEDNGWKAVVEDVANKGTRLPIPVPWCKSCPEPSPAGAEATTKLIQQCWSAIPNDRPSWKVINTTLKSIISHG
eukprot:TRINITY_DN9656_c0_g1_i1.p2 TRINITY_DN9656_c0_g1~~TRINITY_DN9656_c0_g1_i1.p2  ORF type:complete len:227 (+),score=33.50 TRINITY_DN9656_c0_g1_i1:582-1262(+)